MIDRVAYLGSPPQTSQNPETELVPPTPGSYLQEFPLCSPEYPYGERKPKRAPTRQQEDRNRYWKEGEKAELLEWNEGAKLPKSPEEKRMTQAKAPGAKK